MPMSVILARLAALFERLSTREKCLRLSGVPKQTLVGSLNALVIAAGLNSWRQERSLSVFLLLPALNREFPPLLAVADIQRSVLFTKHFSAPRHLQIRTSFHVKIGEQARFDPT